MHGLNTLVRLNAEARKRAAEEKAAQKATGVVPAGQKAQDAQKQQLK